MGKLASVPEVAARFGVTNQTVRNWIAAGRLPAIQPTARGRFRIPSEAVDAFEQDAGSRARQPADDEAGPPTDDAEAMRVVGAIVDAVHPDEVILFGSRARGDATERADIDLALVVSDGSDRRRVAMSAYDSLAAVPGRSVAVDIVVLTPRMISAEQGLPGSIVRSVVREGRSLYRSASRA